MHFLQPNTNQKAGYSHEEKGEPNGSSIKASYPKGSYKYLIPIRKKGILYNLFGCQKLYPLQIHDKVGTL